VRDALLTIRNVLVVIAFLPIMGAVGLIGGIYRMIKGR
jgi:hypothetical protein